MENNSQAIIKTTFTSLYTTIMTKYIKYNISVIIFENKCENVHALMPIFELILYM